jgi:hypothetical protein
MAERESSSAPSEVILMNDIGIPNANMSSNLFDALLVRAAWTPIDIVNGKTLQKAILFVIAWIRVVTLEPGHELSTRKSAFLKRQSHIFTESEFVDMRSERRQQRRFRGGSAGLGFAWPR